MATRLPGTKVSTFFPVDVLKLKPVRATFAASRVLESVIVEFESVNGCMSAENSTAMDAMFDGILVPPLNGEVPTTLGGVMFVNVCPAAPVVDVATKF